MNICISFKVLQFIEEGLKDFENIQIFTDRSSLRARRKDFGILSKAPPTKEEKK
jgi:hypothetical protein